MTRNIVYPNQHILIVDDSKSNLLVLRQILKAQNIENIYEAVSAKEAYEILAKEAIDAILLDVKMPEIDGIQACKTIRQNTKHVLIPILMVTASKDNDVIQKSFDAGANDFIEKPINAIELMGRLNSQLRQREMEKSLIESSRYNAKDEMISMLAHQWRQPLSIINILTSSIQTTIALEGVDEKQILDSLKEIEGAVKDLSDLLSGFTTAFSTLKNTQITNMDHLIENVIFMIQPLFIGHKIVLTKKRTQLGEYSIDKQSLTQVLINIITNSVESFRDFSNEKAEIIIDAASTNDTLIISVIDNGKGIDKEHKPYIFEPYYTTKEERNGKGLGLFIARQLVTNKLNGALTIDSSDELTTAKITLNLSEFSPA